MVESTQESKESEAHTVKVVLLGETGISNLIMKQGVGKSSIILRFVADEFRTDIGSTLGAVFFSKNVQVGEETVKFQINLYY